MKAVAQPRYGPPEVLELREIAKPAVDDDGVLVRVHAVSLNAGDRLLLGRPFFVRFLTGWRRPQRSILGTDLAGRVEDVGKNVIRFKPGAEVFGTKSGACAEYVVARERTLASKPERLTFEQAAAIPVAGITALQGLRDRGRIQSGGRVLINGASGGVGTFAVQIAKAYGAQVTAVCSTRHVDLVRSLGADDVIDYTKEDFARTEQRYDLILDVAGNRSMSDFRRVLVPTGTVVLVGAPKRWFTLVRAVFQLFVLARFANRPQNLFLARITRDDLTVLKDLIDAGKVTPVVDRTYPLSEAAAAMRYLVDGHARGKIVITV